MALRTKGMMNSSLMGKSSLILRRVMILVGVGITETVVCVLTSGGILAMSRKPGV